MTNDTTKISAAAMAENAWKYRKSNIWQGDAIERMIEKIHAAEDECPHLRVECYGEEEVAVSEPEVRPLGQLDQKF